MSAQPDPTRTRIQLVCAASTLSVLRAALVSGADAIAFELAHEGIPQETSGQRLTSSDAEAAVRHAHNAGAKAILQLNTYPGCASATHARHGIDVAAELRVDAIELSDPGLMHYTARAYPGIPLHVGARAGVTSYEGVNFYHEHFGAKRVVVSRTLGLPELEALTAGADADIEICGFGSACIMIGGHCGLSSYVTGASVNTTGVCSPANGVCRGCYEVVGQKYEALDVNGTLNALDLVPMLKRVGIAAVRIETRHAEGEDAGWATRVWHDAIRGPDGAFDARDTARAPTPDLHGSAEGRELTLGTYSPPWR